MWNSFERITWSFQNRLSVAYSTVPTSDEGDGLDGDHPEDSPQQPPVPLDVAEQRVDERERDEEEADVLDRFREVGRVERLQRVEDDDRGQDVAATLRPGRRVLSPPWGSGRASSPPRHPRHRRTAALRSRSDGGEDSAGDHQVERHQEVRGVAAGVERDAERERGDDRERDRRRPAAEGGGEDGARPRSRRSPAPTSRAGSSRRSEISGEFHWSARIRSGKQRTANSIAAERRRPAGSRIEAAAAAEAASRAAPARTSLKSGPRPRPGDGSPSAGRRGCAVQAHHAARDQRPVLAEHFHPQLVAARRGHSPTPDPAVPVEGEEGVALQVLVAGEGDDRACRRA